MAGKVAGCCGRIRCIIRTGIVVFFLEHRLKCKGIECSPLQLYFDLRSLGHLLVCVLLVPALEHLDACFIRLRSAYLVQTNVQIQPILKPERNVGFSGEYEVETQLHTTISSL